MSEPAHWVCQVCHTPIDGNRGFIEIINTAPELGPVGSYPKGSPPPPLSPATRPISSAQMAAEFLSRKQRHVDFLVHHDGCDPHPDTQGYAIDCYQVPTLEHWVYWVLHLFSKSWMGRQDLEALLRFWWSHKRPDSEALLEPDFAIDPDAHLDQ